MSEEYTKSLVFERLKEMNYPSTLNKEHEGVTVFKEDSFKKFNTYLEKNLSKASKNLTDKAGAPDYIILDKKKNILIVIECKKNVSNHMSAIVVEGKSNENNTKENISKFAVDGAIHYATYLNSKFNVIAIGVSGNHEENMKVTSFFLPKKEGVESIINIEDSDLNTAIMSLEEYKDFIEKNDSNVKIENEKIYGDLSVYAAACSNYLRANGISAKDRAGFISSIVLALTNEDSSLYLLTELSYENNKEKMEFISDKLKNNAINLLKESLIDIWEKKDKLPKIKRDSLEEYYNKILGNNLLEIPEGASKYFQEGENFLSTCMYSIYRNIIIKWKAHTDLDIMGTFYTVFLKYASGDAKDKGIVLTPKHITELFCDIAEHFLGKKLDETTRCLDICAGTGGFLISALNRMDYNINKLKISDKEKDKRKEKIRKECLIGVEKEPEMFALAYANMRFHGDGKSSLYSCSSLLKDDSIVGLDEKKQKDIKLIDELKNRKPKIGMINPPYSLKSTKDKSKKASGQSELDFVYSMLEYLDKDGIGIAIVPLSCAGTKGEQMRKIILEKHTLLACMTMPKNLFQDSKVGTATCIMVFRAHVQHSNSSKNVFVSRWTEDGFSTVPHSGRNNREGKWDKIKINWKNQLANIAESNPYQYMVVQINGHEECSAEAFVKTDYSQLSLEKFEIQLKRYSLFKYTIDNNVVMTGKEMLFWLLGNLQKFEKDYSQSFVKNKKYTENWQTEIVSWRKFNLTELFEFSKGKYYPSSSYINGKTPLVTASEENNGRMSYTNLESTFDKNTITIGKVNMTSFYQPDDYVCSHDVTVLTPKLMFNQYIAMFILGVMSLEKFRWDYGRQIQMNAAKTVNIKLPCIIDHEGKFVLDKDGNEIPDLLYMESFIKELSFSKKI